jgi:hypothetical protein
MATTQVSTSVLKDGSVTSAKLDTNIAITGDLTVDTNTLYVDSANNRVGIGTDSPASILHTQGAGGATSSPIIETTDTNSYVGLKIKQNGDFWISKDNSTGSSFNTSPYANVLWGNGSYPMVFSTNSVERMRVTSSGKIGIGTKTPVNAGHIKTSTNGEGLTLQINSVTEGDYSQLSFVPSTADATGAPIYIRGVRGSSFATSYLTFNTDYSERMRIDSSGVVQVRNTEPILQLYNTDTSLVADQVLGGLEFYGTDPSGAGVGVRSAIRTLSASSTGASYGLYFYTSSGSTNDIERVIFKSNGDVTFKDGSANEAFYWDASTVRLGIGTDSPQRTLHINSGTVNDVALFQSTNQRATVTIQDSFAKTDISHNVGQFEINIDPDNVGSASKLVINIDGSEKMQVSNSGDISFRDTSNNEAFYWDASTASLGIGTGSSPDTLIHGAASQGATLRLESTTTTLQTGGVLGAIEFETQDSGSEGVNAKINSVFENTVGATSMQFFTSAAFATITSTPQMVIDSSGDLDIKAGSLTLNQGQVINFKNVARDTTWGGIQGLASGTVFSFGGNEQMRITSGGDISFRDTSANEAFYWDASTARVGIGVGSSPQRSLHILRNEPQIRLESTASNCGIEILTSATKSSWLIGAQYNVDGGFEITPSTAVGGTTFSSPALVVKSSGNVGIGTDSPATTLEVSTVGTGNGNGQVLAETQGANGNAGYGFRTNGTTRWAIVTIGTDGANDLRFYNFDNSAERMRITSAGAIHLSQGTGNTFVGTNAGNLGTSTGTNISAFGVDALRSNTTGVRNTASGYNSLYNNTTGIYNTATGGIALNANTTGSNNTAVGYQSLRYNVDADYNTAVGVLSLRSTTSGGNNTSVGYESLRYSTSGASNTAIGGYALGNITTGNNNVAIGWDSAASSASVSNEITLGNTAITTLRCNTQTISSLSDIRDKKDIKELQGAEAFIKELKPVSFVWNQRDGGRVDIDDNGFIAQDLIEAQEKSGHKIPNLVLENNPEKLEAAYGAMLPTIVSALQSALKEIDLLKTEIETLKNK